MTLQFIGKLRNTKFYVEDPGRLNIKRIPCVGRITTYNNCIVTDLLYSELESFITEE